MRETGIEVGDRATGLLNRIDKTGDDYHLDQLSAYLTQVKQQFPAEDRRHAAARARHLLRAASWP